MAFVNLTLAREIEHQIRLWYRDRHWRRFFPSQFVGKDLASDAQTATDCLIRMTHAGKLDAFAIVYSEDGELLWRGDPAQARQALERKPWRETRHLKDQEQDPESDGFALEFILSQAWESNLAAEFGDPPEKIALAAGS